MTSGLSHYLGHRHSIAAVICTLAALIPVQFPTNVPGKAAEGGPNQESRWSFQLLPLVRPKAGYCGHLGTEPVNVKSLCHSVFK